ncbi:TPA: endopeptidase La [Candidatus Ventrenecus avicola]|nr:endopeptidase La [Candidatus Ventrenecus avicola]
MAKTLPVMLLKKFVLLPNQEVKLELNNELSHQIIDFSEKEYMGKIVIVSPKDTLEEVPLVEDLPVIAVEASIVKRIELSPNHERITLIGNRRIKVQKYYNCPNIKEALQCDYYIPQLPKLNETDEISRKRELLKLLKQYVKTSPMIDNSILQEIQEHMSLDEITDRLAFFLPMHLEKKMSYVEEINSLKRADNLIEDFIVELQILKLDQKINVAVQKELETSQKEFVLRERIKELQKELGESGDQNKEAMQYREKLASLDIPNRTKQKIEKEIQKYELMNEMSPDMSFVRNYLETFFSLPWNDESIEATDLNYIKSTLNKSHYGLKEVKTRILEYAAMRERNPMLTSPILCLVGPPGVGKSTIASSIATSLHRTFYKISVGGLNDSAELVGHRRTYLGSSPGKIIQALQKCGSKNPVLLIDEVDKMVKDYKGDPASVLLDVLDPNLNQTFMDAYLEEPFDLSHVLFILTANYKEDIPLELRDRLEIIELSSYSTLEKLKLAKEYLLPSIYLEYHLSEEEVVFSDEALESVILNYTSEAGVRDLRRKLETILRKVIMESVKDKKNLNVIIEKKDIKKYLDETLSFRDYRPKLHTSGLVNGLAVTGVGGFVMPIESTLYDGTGKVVMTGLLGDVMKESLNVVMSYLKANAKYFQINESFFSKKDVHIHVLEGSIPKNGPSAGVAITTSLISLYTNKKVPSNIAMTGEMTLRGEILPVGGIKEKVISAYNSQIHTIYLPKANEMDVKKVPKEIRDSMHIVFVKQYKDIYHLLFL